MIANNVSTLKIHKLTQKQYERELAAGRLDENALYLTPDEGVDLSAYATKDEIPTVDTAMSSTSTNPVQNKVVKAAIDALANEANSDTRVKYENNILQTLNGVAIQLGGDVKVSTGSYIGTGKYGSSNPTTLTFNIEPYFVVIIGCHNSTYDQVTWGNFIRGSAYGVSEAVGMAEGGTGLITLYTTWAGKNITFYSKVSAPLQLNSSSVTYNYIVIGK